MFFNKYFHLLKPIEKEVLSQIAGRLDENTKNIFNNQINYFNFVQRLNNGKEINFYHKKIFKVFFDNRLLFPNQKDEIKFAKVKISYFEKNKEKNIIAEVWVVKGRLFSITFNNSPHILDNIVHSFKSVEIFDDLMTVIKRIEIDLISDSIIEWIKVISADLSVIKAFKPVNKTELNLFLNKFSNKFPFDWLELLNLCDGIVFKTFTIKGTYNVREIQVENEEYIILAEDNFSNLLALKKNDIEPNIFLIDSTKDIFEPLNCGSNLRHALRKFL